MIKKFLIMMIFAVNLAACSLVQTTSLPETPRGQVLLDAPQPNQLISSPMSVYGQAPGNWFFEGQVLAKIELPDGTVIATQPIKAEGEWMTSELVPFNGEMTFSVPVQAQKASFVVESDNPSGQSDNVERFEVPVRFH